MAHFNPSYTPITHSTTGQSSTPASIKEQTSQPVCPPPPTHKANPINPMTFPHSSSSTSK